MGCPEEYKRDKITSVKNLSNEIIEKVREIENRDNSPVVKTNLLLLKQYLEKIRTR
jgi:hypothetical protein